MIHKRIGNIEITTSRDSEWVTVKYWYNGSTSSEIELRSNEDVTDLTYALECVRNEQSRRVAERGSAK